MIAGQKMAVSIRWGSDKPKEAGWLAGCACGWRVPPSSTRNLECGAAPTTNSNLVSQTCVEYLILASAHQSNNLT
ncbi:hypothetical protein TWF217_003199, partial [Orbilia oligospora]